MGDTDERDVVGRARIVLVHTHSRSGTTSSNYFPSTTTTTAVQKNIAVHHRAVVLRSFRCCTT